MHQLPRASFVFALLAMAFGACEEPEFQSTPLLPSEYRMSFVEVRSCAASVGHDLAHVVVRTSPQAADVYRTGQGTFPAGSVIVLEMFGDASCRDLTGWAVMRKEARGYDDGFGDWRWQELNTFRRVLSEGKNRQCTDCHGQTNCRARDFTCASR